MAEKHVICALHLAKFSASFQVGMTCSSAIPYLDTHNWSGVLYGRVCLQGLIFAELQSHLSHAILFFVLESPLYNSEKETLECARLLNPRLESCCSACFSPSPWSRVQAILPALLVIHPRELRLWQRPARPAKLTTCKGEFLSGQQDTDPGKRSCLIGSALICAKSPPAEHLSFHEWINDIA